MNEKITNTLFEVSQELTSIHSNVKANPVLHDSFNLNGIGELQGRVHELWRELMKANS